MFKENSMRIVFCMKTLLLQSPYTAILKPKSVKILQLLIKKACSVQEISYITQIPIATCYRIVNDLTSAKLVNHVDTQLSHTSNVKIYRSAKATYTIQITGNNRTLK